MDGILDALRDELGGGTLSLWMMIAGVVALWLAIKAVSALLRLVALTVAVVLFLGVAPWAGEDVDSDPAACARALVEEQAEGWRTVVAKRVTVDEVSPDAACDEDGIGLSAGSAVVKLRTFFDVPFQTWDVDDQGATVRFDPLDEGS